MKCPKCGYNSFEYYDRCKKCSDDLIGYKHIHNITPLVIPLESREQLAAELKSSQKYAAQIDEAPESHDDIFSFDLPETSTPGAASGDDPFNFDEPLNIDRSAKSAASEEDTFGDLLEATSQTDESPFANTKTAAAPGQQAKPSTAPGEFDLESFSWDETTAADIAPDSTESDNDFDSLFGNTTENSKK